jgi:hypothetical protein
MHSSSGRLQTQEHWQQCAWGSAHGAGGNLIHGMLRCICGAHKPAVQATALWSGTRAVSTANPLATERCVQPEDTDSCIATATVRGTSAASRIWG